MREGRDTQIAAAPIALFLDSLKVIDLTNPLAGELLLLRSGRATPVTGDAQ